MSLSEVAVRVTIKRSIRNGKEYISYAVALPRKIAEELGFKGGDILHVRIVELEINGRKVKGALYYKS